MVIFGSAYDAGVSMNSQIPLCKNVLNFPEPLLGFQQHAILEPSGAIHHACFDFIGALEL